MFVLEHRVNIKILKGSNHAMLLEVILTVCVGQFDRNTRELTRTYIVE